ncbi:MAG TPA: DUF1491 family protein [Aurantimonas sp.]|uniref:DUF1491 family protein n=1 Tax=Aurantimonas marianensis TaxID=2920428 RepID=A0A9X2H630_9HYPH|nr:DUF1491 family protein [Aurantimonas marianensis]MCP3054861.1 DUF1491 family protein [Aurantimonas marianensis]
MRITSELFVAQLIRRLFAAGGFAVVARKGADAAGAIYVVTRNRGGEIQLFGPAVQSLGDDSGTRQFMLEPVNDEAGLEARFAREARFDPDFWVVEIETDDAPSFLQIVEG